MIQKLDKNGNSSIDNANVVILDKNGNVKTPGGALPFLGTINTLPKFLTPTTLGDSQIVDDGTNITVGGGYNFFKFNVNGSLFFREFAYMLGDFSDLQGYDTDGLLIGKIGFNKYNGAVFGTATYLPLQFLQNNIEVGRFSYLGNFLIATTIDNGQKLQVEGDALINGLTVGRGGGNIAVNVVLGSNALALNTVGLYNVAIGTTAIYSNTTGDNNIGIGANSLYLNTTGSGNLGIGPSTRCLNPIDNNSIMVGFDTVGKGSNTVVLGNDSITDTYLKGAVHIDQGLILNGVNIESAWIPYTPTWKANTGTPPSIGNGTLEGAYKKIGKTVYIRIKMTTGTTTTYGTATGFDYGWIFSLPIAPEGFDQANFASVIYQNSASYYQGIATNFSTGIGILCTDIDNYNSHWANSTFPFTWGGIGDGSGCFISFNGTYECV